MQTQPVSVIIDRNVVPGKQAEFETLLNGIIEVSSHRKGYLGTNVTKPKSKDNNYYQVIFRFDSQENLDVWIQSEDRKKWVEKIDHVLEKPTQLQFITGLETWFCLPGTPTITPPPRYKMAVVAWLAITPLLIVFNYSFDPLFKDLALVPRFICMTPWIVLIMTYILMPFMTKLFKWWLYPRF